VVRGATESIFHRIGGFAAVSRVVSDFYSSVLASPILRPFFAGVDMATQIDHQTKFVATLMGGPSSYTDEHLARVHAHLGIDGRAFEEMARTFRETLEDHGLDETDIGKVMQQIQSRRTFVVTA
jgi:hemoglobin